MTPDQPEIGAGGGPAGAIDAGRRRLWPYLVPLAMVTVGGFIGTALMPSLLAKAPLGLIALSPLFRHLVLVAPRVDEFALFAVAVPRHFFPDPFVYHLGLHYGPVAVKWMEANSPGTGKFMKRLERLFAAVGPVALLVWPDLICSTLAGVARVRFPVFVAMNLVGTVANVFVAKWIGDALEHQIEMLVAFFRAHLVQVTVASVLLVVLVNWLSSRGRPVSEG